MTSNPKPAEGKRKLDTVVRMCELVAALAKGPKTLQDLEEMVGAHESTLLLWLKELKDSGMAYLADKGEAAGGVQGRKPQRWALQPRPFAYQDFATPAEVLEAERLAFEALAKPLGYDLSNDSAPLGDYNSLITTALWRGWRARVGV
ncbi:hypothetical protein [Ideonella paludis]|uniref:Helix-turn-helix domain-containing protein n=1 Tax=Ideonella paludis TaxID=1233411 RepID=A0ABS5DZZ8_9BURK|nr:hypothetical protein [Ideonella paludis]MBQ0936738.1 hypothetical protein [Ideonella paludis]